MLELSQQEFEKNFGKYIGMARWEPLRVMQSGEPAVVVFSYKEFEGLLAIEDAYWAIQAHIAAQKQEFVSHDAAMRYLHDAMAKSK